MYIEKFIDYLRLEKRYSNNTLISYQTDLLQFQEHLADNFQLSIHQVASWHVRSWLSGLVADKISAKSVNRKISSIKSYFRFLELKGVVSANPMNKVSAPKNPTRLPVFLTNENITSLFEEFEFPQGFGGIRDRLMLETFYCTGIRLSELTSIKHGDIDLSRKEMKVIGKGNKQRVIPLISSWINSYQAYMQLKSIQFSVNSTEPVFVTDKGKKVYPRFVYRQVNFYLSTTTTVSKRSPHVLRHTFATHMLNNGADINAIKDLLGHSSLSATEVYTHNTVEKIKSVYKQAHPKA